MAARSKRDSEQSEPERAGPPMVAKDMLRSLVERIEHLEEEKKSLLDDIKEIYEEAKSTGFDVKALRTVIRARKMDADERAEHEMLVETYMSALGQLGDTPLGKAAIARDLRAN